MNRSLLSCVATVLLVLAGVGSAQLAPARITVILSASGASASVGAAQRVALLGVRPEGVSLEFRDDRSDPAVAVAEATAALDAGAEALICCSSVRASEAVAEVAEAAGVLLLIPGTVPEPATRTSASRYSFELGVTEAGEWEALGAHLAASGLRSVALMTLTNGFGGEAAARLAEEAARHQLRVVADERIGPDEAVVTPQALWIATRQPDAVIVWGLRADTQRAVDALRRRGYRGPIYVRRALETDGQGLDPSLMAGVRVAVVPARVATSLDASDPRATPGRRLASALLGVGGYRDVPEAAALTYDAIRLVAAAHDQASVYGVPRDDADAYRQALRDAAVALPPQPGAGGVLDLTESSGGAAAAGSLVFAEVTAGGLVAVR